MEAQRNRRNMVIEKTIIIEARGTRKIEIAETKETKTTNARIEITKRDTVHIETTQMSRESIIIIQGEQIEEITGLRTKETKT